MNENDYTVLLVFTMLSLAFCLFLPLYAAQNYVRFFYGDAAWYIPISDGVFNDENDGPMVGNIVIPSLLVIYATFFHHLLLPLIKPEHHQSRILPIFQFDNKFMKTLGKILSYICIFTMPVFIPLGVSYVYNTNVDFFFSPFVYLFPMMLMFGALLFIFFYVIYFIRMTLLYRRKKDVDEKEWFVY